MHYRLYSSVGLSLATKHCAFLWTVSAVGKAYAPARYSHLPRYIPFNSQNLRKSIVADSTQVDVVPFDDHEGSTASFCYIDVYMSMRRSEGEWGHSQLRN